MILAFAAEIFLSLRHKTAAQGAFDDMPNTLQLPVLPLRNTVLFPGISLPITVGRPETMAAIEAAMASGDQAAFIVAQREDSEQVLIDNLHTTGIIAKLGGLQRGRGGQSLTVHALSRGAVLRYEPHEGGFLAALVKPIEEAQPVDSQDPAFQGLWRELRERAAELANASGLPKEIVKRVVLDVEEPGRFTDLVAAYVEADTAKRQELLETLPVEDRMRRVLLLVQHQLMVVQAQQEIQSKVREELGDRQRESLLRQQLKAIQDELGEGDDRDIDDLRERLDALELPDSVRKEIDREWARLRRIGRESGESQVIRTFLETIAELPWTERSDEHLEIQRAAEILDEDHHGLQEVKDRVLEFLAVRQLRQAAATSAPKHDGGDDVRGNPDDRAKAPILLFVGPPGVGKTSVAKSIARATGREYVRISLGGARDEADIRGHRRTYVGAMPGRVIKGMREAGTRNPVFLLDEVDKLGVSFQGDPASALLEVLDPAQNDSFVDHYLGVPFDLSEVMFVATANFLQGIPGPLLDRMEVVEFSGYTEAEKLDIARRYLIPRQLAENGLDPEQVVLHDDALRRVISSYTREAGLRQLERAIGKLARKVARRVAAGAAPTQMIGAEQVSELLGRPRVHPERAAPIDQIGVATGMYYTPAGGDIMFVEAATMPGKGELVLTGQLGDVMRESARAAWTFARSHADTLSIDSEAFKSDLHIHVPAGAVPKDGPSAGIAMATAVVSALSRRPARRDVAMTGEMTLTGRVLPIGGVKEKVLGAVRAGVTTIVLPADNEADLDDLPAEVRDGLEIHLVHELGEALALTLRDARLVGGRLTFQERGQEGHVQAH
jgi:ATP-dependent Lon protease